MTPYSKEFTITTTGANEVVALDFPGRCRIRSIQALNLGGGSHTIDFYSRAFAGPVIAIGKVRSGSGGKAEVVLEDFLPVRPSDAVTIAGSHADYNGTRRVTKVVQSPTAGVYAQVPALVLTLDVAYSVDAEGGTAQTVVPAAEEPLFKVAGLTGAGIQTTAAEFEYKNQDPEPKRNIGTPRKIYARVLAAGTYRIVIRSAEGIGMGG